MSDKTPTSPSKKVTSSSASKIEELRQQKRDLKKKLKSSRRKSEGLFPGTITPPITPTKHLNASNSDTMKGAILGGISPQAEKDPAMKEAIDLLLGTYRAPAKASGADEKDLITAKVYTPSAMGVSSPRPKLKVTPLPSSPEIAHKHLSQQRAKNKQTVGVQRGIPSEVIPIPVENLEVSDATGSTTPGKSTSQEEFSPLNSSPRKKMFGDDDKGEKKDTRQRLDTEESFDYNKYLASSEVASEDVILDSTPATPTIVNERDEYEVMDALISSTGDIETPLRHVGKQLFTDTPASASLLASLDDLSLEDGSNTLLYVGLIRALLVANGRLKFKFYCLLFYRWKRLVYKLGVDTNADEGIVLYLQGTQAVIQQKEEDASTEDLNISMTSMTSGTSASSGGSKKKKSKKSKKKTSPRKSSPTKKRSIKSSEEDTDKRVSTGSTLSTITVDSDASEWSNLNSPRPSMQHTNGNNSTKTSTKSNKSDASTKSSSPVSNILNTTVAVDTAMKRREAKRLSDSTTKTDSSPSSGKISPSSLLRASMTSTYGSNLNASLGSTVDSSPSKGKKKKKKLKSPSKAAIKAGSGSGGKATVPSAAVLALSPKRSEPARATPPTLLQPYFDRNASYFKSLFKCYSQRYAAASIGTTFMTVEEYWTLLREFNIGPSAIGKRQLQQTIRDIDTSASSASTPLRSGSPKKTSSSVKKTPPRATSRTSTPGTGTSTMSRSSVRSTPSSTPNKPSHTTTVNYEEFLLALTILSSEMKFVSSASTTPTRSREKESSTTGTSGDMEAEGLRRWNRFLGIMVDSEGAACVYRRRGVKLPVLATL